MKTAKFGQILKYDRPICLWIFFDDGKVGGAGYNLISESQGKEIMNEAMSKVLKYGFRAFKLYEIEVFMCY